MCCVIWHHLYNLKNVENTHGGVFLFIKLQAKGCNCILKVTLLRGWSSRLFGLHNSVNGNKSRKAFHVILPPPIERFLLHYNPWCIMKIIIWRKKTVSSSRYLDFRSRFRVFDESTNFKTCDLITDITLH